MSSSFATKEADSEEDPVVLMLQKTGCIELHYKVQVTPKANTFEVENLWNFVFPPGVHCRDSRLEEVPRGCEGIQGLHAGIHEAAASEIRKLSWLVMFFFRQFKLVLVIRSDLKLSKGKTASQAAHASVMCFKKALESNPSLASKWLRAGQPKIVLKVDSLSDLEDLESRAEESGVITSLVHDAGRTEIAAGTATCLGLGPDHDEKIDALVKNLKLL